MAGTLVTAARKLFYFEGLRFRGAVSEAVVQRMAQNQNFISLYQYSEKKFVINGSYAGAATPFLGLDGLLQFPFDAEIFDVCMFNHEAGTSGTTEIDLKVASSSGGSYSTIFTTTPKIASTAGAFAYVTKTGAVTGCTNPVLAAGAATIAAGSALRCDILSVMAGAPKTCGIIAHYRPR